jgi:hypothetical protein
MKVRKKIILGVGTKREWISSRYFRSKLNGSILRKF